MSVMNDKLIKQWVDEGLITLPQAEKMLADVKRERKEQSSNKFIIAVSTFGALLLGIGAILFVASNWNELSSLGKVLILIGSTLGAYYAGFVLKYEKQNLPRVGEALLFLGALLFGASLFLIAQIYHVNANSHALVFMWLAGVLPLVYAFGSAPIAALSSFLFYLWMGLFLFRNASLSMSERDLMMLPAFYLVAGILLFSIGGLHYFHERLRNVARVYRLIGIQVAVVTLYLLTFKALSGQNPYGIGSREELHISAQFTTGFVLFSIAALINSVINLFFNPSRSETNTVESYICVGLLMLSLIFLFCPPIADFYVVVFNLLMAGILLTLIFVGYNREDASLVNIGMRWAGFFILTKYFDFFWALLPRSLFFMVGGLILVLGGIALEKKRKELNQQFAKT